MERVFTLAVTTTPKAWPQNRRWTADSTYVCPAVGLHPELAGQRYGEIGLLEEYIGESRFVGEIGLDGTPPHRKSWPQQLQVFTRAIRRAQQVGDRVLSIHSRRAEKEVVTALAEHTTPSRVVAILHWFSGSASAARTAIAQGCYFSINSRMLEHETGRSLVRGLPRERLLTETDAPFTSRADCVPEPADALKAAKDLAGALGIDDIEMNVILTENARSLLRS